MHAVTVYYKQLVGYKALINTHGAPSPTEDVFSMPRNSPALSNQIKRFCQNGRVAGAG